MFVAGVVEVLESLQPLVGKLADEPIASDEAAELVGLAVELERLGVAIRMLAARAVHSDHWKARGFRSAAAWMAAEASMPVGPAIAAMETLRLLDELPATGAAFREGRLSLAQVSEVADVAAEWPATEQQLLDAAEVMSLAGLKEECRRVKAAAVTDEDDRYRRLRKGRYLRSWTDRDGAVRLSARLTPDEGARGLQIDHLGPYVETRYTSVEGLARLCPWHHYLKSHCGYTYRGGPGTWEWIPPETPTDPPLTGRGS